MDTDPETGKKHPPISVGTMQADVPTKHTKHTKRIPLEQNRSRYSAHYTVAFGLVFDRVLLPLSFVCFVRFVVILLNRYGSAIVKPAQSPKLPA
jgi:hypothetical protein